MKYTIQSPASVAGPLKDRRPALWLTEMLRTICPAAALVSATASLHVSTEYSERSQPRTLMLPCSAAFSSRMGASLLRMEKLSLTCAIWPLLERTFRPAQVSASPSMLMLKLPFFAACIGTGVINHVTESAAAAT